MEPEQTEPAATEEPAAEPAPAEPVQDPYSSDDMKADAEQNQIEHDATQKQATTYQEQNQAEHDQTQAMIEAQDAETGEPITGELMLVDEQWNDVEYWANDLEMSAVLLFNVAFGVIIGYIAARGFFDSWRNL